MAGFVSWLRSEWDRVTGVALIVVGACSLAAGYAGVAGAAYVPQALSFIASGGFFGLLLVAVGSTMLITAALHDEWRKLDRIEKAIDRLADGLGAANGPSAAPITAVPPLTANGAGGSTPPVQAVLAAALEPTGGGTVTVRPAAPSAALLPLAGLAVAAALVGAGSVGTSNAVHDDTAFAGLLLGIAGLAVAGLTSASWTLALRRRARRRQVRLLGPWAAVLDTAATNQPGAVRSGPGMVAVADGLTRFHHPGCQSLSGVEIRLVDAGAAARAGLARCRLCDDLFTS